MSYNESVASFIDALGPFYEYVDIPGIKKVENHVTNNNIISVKGSSNNENSDQIEEIGEDDGYIPISNGHVNGNSDFCQEEEHSSEEADNDPDVSDITLENYSAASVISVS